MCIETKKIVSKCAFHDYLALFHFVSLLAGHTQQIKIDNPDDSGSVGF